MMRYAGDGDEESVREEEKEICSYCGRSVAWGSGWFVNRVPRGDTQSEREQWGMPHPEGGWLCEECAEGDTD
jgi:hypothetical protein